MQGSRFEPYAVDDPHRAGGDGEGLLGLIPERGEMLCECSCPDAETFGACKHGLAVLLVLADEISIETEVLERWRAGDPEHVPGRPPPAAGRRSTPSATCWRPSLRPLPDAGSGDPAPVCPSRWLRPPTTATPDVAAAVAAAIAVLRTR